jgi:UDP-N-acetylmuramate dehydrogenase
MIELLENIPLAKYTSWRIGGPARFLAAATDLDALHKAIELAAIRNLPLLMLGGGTNMLVRDSGWPGIVVRYRDQSMQLTDRGDLVLARIGAGAPMAGTARRMAHQGLAGLEWAEGLPGTIGGAVFGNAGCYGGDIAHALTRAWVLVGDMLEEWPVERFAYGYRTSTLKVRSSKLKVEGTAVPTDSQLLTIGRSTAEASVQRSTFNIQPSTVDGQPGPIILAAEFALRRAVAAELEAKMEATAALRRSKTPWGSSCGSVFKNPPGESAGRLIEAAGLKGARIGAAEIAEKHANYMINRGGASSDDVLALIDMARERVLREFGVALELEVQVVG